MIEGQCSVCRRSFKVDDRYAGMTGRCKTCGAAIRVPGEPDVGLDGLPPAPKPPEAVASAPPQAQPVPAAPPPAPTPPAATASEPTAPAPAPAPQPTPAPPADPRPLAAERPHPADELTRPHDARARFEVSEGPTALKGSWLQEPEREAPSEPEPPPEAEPAAPPPARALLAERLITPPEPEPRATLHLPALVRVACGALGLLAVGFALHFSTAGRWGLAAAGLGLALAGLGAVRLWMGHWDGLLAALLFCLGVAGSTRVRPDLWLANRVLLAGAALTLLLLLVAVIRRSGRDYFTT